MRTAYNRYLATTARGNRPYRLDKKPNTEGAFPLPGAQAKLHAAGELVETLLLADARVLQSYLDHGWFWKYFVWPSQSQFEEFEAAAPFNVYHEF